MSKTGGGVIEKTIRIKGFRLHLILWVFLYVLGLCDGATAIEIDTGNPNIQMRWDNTIRYTYAYRVGQLNQDILANPNTDDGDRNFSSATVGNRLDLLSELDLIFKKDYGFRASGAGWYDHAYNSINKDHSATSNTLLNGRPQGGELNSYTKRYYLGPNGELLDLFVFGKIEADQVPINIKIGRHTVYWGESVLGGGAIHGISYSQMPLDQAKGLMLPGVEAKELFRPVNNISVQAQATRDLTILGQYFMEWEQTRLPESGTYLGFSDIYQEGGESFITGPGQRFLRTGDSKPSPFNNWGVAARYRPDWLDGTAGLYFRRFADTLPQVVVRPFVATLPAATGSALGFTRLGAPGNTPAPYAFSPEFIPSISAGNVGQYMLAYGDDIKSLGFSLSKQILGVSLGAEISYRWNMPLVSGPVSILPTPLAAAAPGTVSSVPSDGQTPGARGNTWHGVLNSQGILSTTPVFDTASWLIEFVWNRWDQVTQNNDVFKGRDGYTAIDRVSKDFFGAALTFTPTWYQVIAGVDLSMPLSYGRGLSGNSAVAGGGNKDARQFSLGLNADFRQQYKFEVKYIGFFGQFENGVPNGTPALLKDRDMIVFTFSTKF